MQGRAHLIFSINGLTCLSLASVAAGLALFAADFAAAAGLTHAVLLSIE